MTPLYPPMSPEWISKEKLAELLGLAPSAVRSKARSYNVTTRKSATKRRGSGGRPAIEFKMFDVDRMLKAMAAKRRATNNVTVLPIVETPKSTNRVIGLVKWFLSPFHW